MAGTLVLLAPLIIDLLYPAEYAASVPLLRLLSLTLFIASVSGTASRGLLTLKKERLAVWLVAITALVNLGTNIILIPRFGPVGAATARTSSAALFAVLTLGTLFVLQRSKRGPAQGENMPGL
jgi:O-antigen/teichoic acid export membrane protein